MQFKQILLYAVFSAYSLVTYAQNYGSVRGYVRTESGEPIPSVSLKVQGGSIGTMSNSSGFFTLQKLSPGRYMLHISGVGYPALEKEINIQAGKESELHITMREESIAMESATVIGRTVVQDRNRQAYNVTAVDAKQLYNTTLDLAGALDRVSGIRVRESGGVGSNFNLSLNGFSGNHVRYFIDGIPMDNFGTSFQINNIPINIAERIEVYKGVVPIWLGSDALGGAINIITGSKQRNYIDASYSYGSFNTHRSVINAALTSEKGLTFRLSAFQNYSDNDYKVKVDAADIYTGAYSPNTWVRRFHDTYHNETLISQVGVVDKPYADQLLLGITLGQNYKEIQTGARMVSVFGAWHRRGNIIMPTLKYKKTDLIKGLDVTLNANYNLGSERNIDTVNARYGWYGDSKPNGSNGERSRSLYKYKNNNGIANAMFNYRIGKKQAIALSNVFTTFNREGTDPLNPEVQENEEKKKSQKNVLGLAYNFDEEDQWSISVFGKHLLQNNHSGSRATTTNKLGYGVAGTYFLQPDLQLKASYERTNRLPEAQEIFGDVENQEGNPDLRPEQSNNINFGISYSFALNPNSKFMVNANAIYRHSDNFIYNRLNNNQSKLIADNREGVRTIGGDGEIRYSYKDWLSAGATITYQYLQNLQQYETGFTGVSPVYKDQMPNIPYLFGNSDVSVSLRLNLGYNLLYVHAFYLYWPSRGGDKLDIPQQLSHDLNLVYSIRNGRYNIGLEGRNIGNALLYDNFSLQKPGRAFYLNLRYFFNK
ncbi:TonB-dependent receptor [Olivibacter sp. XZL3]|uniref:TonB-dependent receptor n=1 Tax=Olivibacter sp. XZL3 TaxID=1735116 RepID=UPI0010655F4B|nr:TonB-dependent receptor [Olivibacter sp. XZL3]